MQIQDTGVRGYLKWLKQDQPGLYRLVAPIIAQRVPEAFSNREQSQAMGALMGFGDDMSENPDAFWSTDVADAANSGAASPTTVNTISNIVSAVAQGYMLKQQADLLNQANQIQLQHAANGTTPLDLSSLKLGVPQVNVGLSSGTLKLGGGALAVAGILGLLIFLGRRGRA